MTWAWKSSTLLATTKYDKILLSKRDLFFHGPESEPFNEFNIQFCTTNRDIGKESLDPGFWATHRNVAEKM